MLMPYRSIADLPPGIRERLPPHAQEIFLQAFNHAWEEYASPSTRYALVAGGDGNAGRLGGGETEVCQGRGPLAAPRVNAYGATPTFLKTPRQSIALAPKSSRALISTPSTSKPMRVSM